MLAFALVTLAVVTEGLGLLGGDEGLGACCALFVVDAGLVVGWSLAAYLVLVLLETLRSVCGARRWIPASVGMVVAILLTVLLVRPVGRTAEEAYWVASVVCGISVWATGWLVLRIAPRFAAIVLGVSVASIAFGFDLLYDATTYLEFHFYAMWLFATAVVSTLARLDLFSSPTPKWTAVVAVTIIGAALAVGVGNPDIKRAGRMNRGWFLAMTSTITPFLDRDGDGFSSLLWDGDCDDSDHATYPGARESARGVDNNCNSLVDVEDRPAARGLRPASGAPHLEPGVSMVVLITLDTFRPEVFVPEVMPATHRFFEEGTVFTNAYAGATSTQLSLPYFVRPQHDARDVRELLREAGIRTPTPADTAALLAELERSERAFLWLHLLELHSPYVSWPDTGEPPDLPPLPPEYISEAMHVDALLAPVWEFLSRPGIAARSLTLLSSDHGEGMGEHGLLGHSRGHWEELVRVPLAMRGPGIEPATRDDLATTRSVPSTILGGFGMAEDATAAERFGRSLLRLRDSQALPSQEFVLAESSRSVSGRFHRGLTGVYVDSSRFKLVVALHDRLMRAYDLQTDPGERIDLVPRRDPRVPRALRRFHEAEDLGALRPQLPRSDYLRVTGI